MIRNTVKSLMVFLKWELRKFCKKQCEMLQIYLQKTVRNAANLCAKNSAKCVKFTCKKHCKMRQIHMQKNTAKCVTFLQIFHINFAHFSVFFAGKFAENCMAIFHIFQALSWWFLWDYVQGWERRVDPGQNAAIPIGIALKNTRFCSAKSTKSEIGAKVGKCR